MRLKFKYYLFKSWNTRKISLKELKKNLQHWETNMFQRIKRKNKVLKKWHILENLLRWTKFTGKGTWAGGGKVNISVLLVLR